LLEYLLLSFFALSCDDYGDERVVVRFAQPDFTIWGWAVDMTRTTE